MRRIVPVIAGWLLAAVIAASAGLLAVSAVNNEFTQGSAQPANHDAVTRAAAGVRQDDSNESPGSTPRKSAVTRTLESPGGSVVARCQDAAAYLVSWAPGQGFESDDEVRGPDESVFVEFESDDLKVNFTVTCRNGVPTGHASTEADD